MNNINLDSTAYTLWWNSRRLFLGDTANFRCLSALLAVPGRPVEHHQMLAAAELGSATHANDVRVLIYRLKKKLKDQGMGDLAAMIRNVRGGYTLQGTQDVTVTGTDRHDGACNNSVYDKM